MFGMMLYATLSLVEKVAPKIRHKHVSELHVIIVGKTSARRSESPLRLVSVLGENTASLLASPSGAYWDYGICQDNMCGKEGRRAGAASVGPGFWSPD